MTGEVGYEVATLRSPFCLDCLYSRPALGFRHRRHEPLAEPELGLPWRDAFAAGDTAGWETFGGAWNLYNGGIRNNSDERGAKFITGSNGWSDYAVDADISLLGDDGDAGIIVRSSDEEAGVDSYSGYYVGLRDSNNITIGRADHGWVEYQAVSPLQPLQSLRWYHLHVVAVGCEIAAAASGDTPGDRTWVTMYEPSCVRTGRIGLRSYSSGGVWKNIRVVKAGLADLAPLLAHAPPGPAPGTLQSEAGFNDLQLNRPGVSPRFSPKRFGAWAPPRWKPSANSAIFRRFS